MKEEEEVEEWEDEWEGISFQTAENVDRYHCELSSHNDPKGNRKKEG